MDLRICKLSSLQLPGAVFLRDHEDIVSSLALSKTWLYRSDCSRVWGHSPHRYPAPLSGSGSRPVSREAASPGHPRSPWLCYQWILPGQQWQSPRRHPASPSPPVPPHSPYDNHVEMNLLGYSGYSFLPGMPASGSKQADVNHFSILGIGDVVVIKCWRYHSLNSTSDISPVPPLAILLISLSISASSDLDAVLRRHYFNYQLVGKRVKHRQRVRVS